MNIQFIQDRLVDAFTKYLGGIVDAFPAVVSGLVVLLIGWLIAKGLRWTLKRFAGHSLDAIAERTGVAGVLAKMGGITLSKLVSGLVYALLLLIFIMASADIMGMELVGRGGEALLAYLPTLLTAVAILIAGLWIGEKVSGVVKTLTESVGLSGGKAIASVLGGLIVLFAFITALNVARVDTALITSNIQIILLSVMLAFAIAYGFASRDILTNILSSFYGKDRFKPGMQIRIGNDEGIIERIDSISLTLRLADRVVIIPTSRLISERIEIIEGNNSDEQEAT